MGRLFWKFFFAFLIVLLMVAAGVGATVWLQKQTHDPMFKDLATGPRTSFMINLASKTLVRSDAQTLRNFLAALKDERIPQVYVVDDLKHEILERSVPEIAFTHAQNLIKQNSEFHIVRRVTTKDGHAYLLFVPRDQTRHDEFRSQAAKPQPSPFIVPIIFGAIASLGCSTFLAWYFSKPIRHLRWALDAVSAGNLDTRVGPLMESQRDEIADLGRNFDHMAHKLQQLVASQQRLLHDVSHELRSPLARLQVAIGLARQKPDKLDSSLDRIEQEVSRFDELVGELLTLSRLETGITEDTDEYFDLTELVRGISEDARFEAEVNKRQLIFLGEGEILIKGRAKLLYRAIENVIRNAVKYTLPSTSVTVKLDRHLPDRVLITVSDYGPGVPEKDLETVFEPFFRSNPGDNVSGYGLGLAIARRAVVAHSGQIRAFNRNPKEGSGLCVEIVLMTSHVSKDHANDEGSV